MSDHKQLCRFCGREIKFLYYCEDCGVACCSDCLRDDYNHYFVCQDCNSKNIEHKEAEDKKICKDCGKENVIKITQHLKACPKCHSLKILNIFEKKEELEQKFLELIKSARIFIQPLRDLITELYLIRHKIKKARDPPIRCYHYPKMEVELLALFKAVNYIIDNLQSKISTHFRHLVLNKEFFFDIYNQPNSNVRIIESILENLVRTHDSIESFSKSNIKDITEKFETFQKNLQFIDKITKLFLPYIRFLKLAEKEKPVYAIRTTLTNGLDSQKRSKKSKGILFITSYDLSFVQESGFFKKTRKSIFKAPIHDLINIRDKGTLFKKLFIKFEYGKYEFSLPSHYIPKIIDYILLARTFQDETSYDHETTKQLQEIDIDLSDLIKYVEEGINSFFSLKCQYNTKFNIEQNQRQQKDIPNNSFYEPNYNLPPIEQAYIGSENQYINHNPQNRSYQWNPNNVRNYYSPPNPDNSMYYRNSNPIPNRENPRMRGPGEYSHFDQSSNQNIPNYLNRNRFYSQNIYHPYRFQNYKPQEKRSPPYYPQSFEGSDYDEKNILMKKLEKEQKLNAQFKSYMQNSRDNVYDDIPTHNHYNNMFNNDVLKKDYQRNHLSELFGSRYPPVDNLYNMEKESFDFDEDANEKMDDLKREQYGLRKTLKELEAQFEKGIISEVDYFKTYKNLQKEIFLIDKKIKLLTKKINDDLFLKRNFDNRKYYS